MESKGNYNAYGPDDQLKAAEKRRKSRRRRVIIVCIALALAVADGALVGRLIGQKNAAASQISGQVSEQAGEPASAKEFISTAEDLPIVTTAMGEAGSANDGGSKFWSWYGYGGRVAWCACFVSWCEDQAGWLSDGTAPRFAYVPDGVSWFKSRGQWLAAGKTPSAGDLIFFDWEQDGGQDHVGIVTAVVGDRVFTVEGNSSDRCRQKRYMLDDPVIYGYGRTSAS